MQRETENQNNFEHVYTLLDLEEPSAKSIRDLENIMGEPLTVWQRLAGLHFPAPFVSHQYHLSVLLPRNFTVVLSDGGQMVLTRYSELP